MPHMRSGKHVQERERLSYRGSAINDKNDKLRMSVCPRPIKSVGVVSIRGVARRISNSARQQAPASVTTP